VAKYGVLVPARNCAPFLAELVARTPLPGDDDEIIVVDDASSDGTFQIASRLPRVHVVRNETQRGYGGTSKRLYEIALARGCDGAVNIHGDLGHAPESVTGLIDVLQRGEADFVFGSRLLYVIEEVRKRGLGRLLVPSARGNMPLSRIAGHRVITAVQNLCYGTRLHSFHEGMRGGSRLAMEWALRTTLPDWYDFDTHLIFRAHRAGLRITEVPLQPHYVKEAKSGVPLMRYGWRAIMTALRHNQYVNPVEGAAHKARDI